MKTLKISMGIIILSLMVISCKNEVQPETKTVEIEQTSMVKEMDENAVIAKAEFNIDGMSHFLVASILGHGSFATLPRKNTIWSLLPHLGSWTPC